jgi:nucleoside-diphosphate-sugar epimerase
MSAEGWNVTVCDRLDRGNPAGLQVVDCDYNALDETFLGRFAAVLWFAGHSSVGSAVQDPDGALANNCLNLISFARRLPPSTRFVYASTGSLYSSRDLSAPPAAEGQLARIPSQNAYDISKFAFDYLAEHFLERFHALRLGTVSGWSPNLRPELVFNAMNLSAVRDGVVRVRNAQAARTILFLDDLWALVRRLLVSDVPPGVCNVGSWSGRIGEMAEAIAGLWGAQVIDEGASATYSFRLDTARMRALCADGLPAPDFAAQCRGFVADCARAGWLRAPVASRPAAA